MSCQDKCSKTPGVDCIFKTIWNGSVDCHFKTGTKHVIEIVNRQPFTIDVESGGGESVSQNLKFNHQGNNTGCSWSQCFTVPSSPRNAPKKIDSVNAEVCKTDKASGKEKIISHARYKYKAPWTTNTKLVRANLDLNI